MTERPRGSIRSDSRLGHGVRRAVRTDATAFGYSVLITATFGVVDLGTSGATVGRLFLFVLGATAGFGLLEVIATRGFRLRVREERSEVVLIGTALAPAAVALGLAGAWALTAVSPDPWAWIIAPLGATATYVVGTGAQLALARWYEERHPTEEEE